MKVFVLNSGSSSIKFQIIETNTQKILMKGLCERIGHENSIYTVTNVEKDLKDKNVPVYFHDHEEAIKKVLSLITDKRIGVLKDYSEIDAIGHRVVHGGEYFKDSAVITDEVLKDIESVSHLAPLHNPANIKGINVCKRLMPDKANVAVFDTSFHQTLEEEKYIYALKYEDYEKYQIRKYGFHGTSVRYIVKKLDKIDSSLKNIIVCHLGNGASITAVKDGKSFDTTMGFTPLAGLPMGTRSGDIDPSILEYLSNVKGFNEKEMLNYLNKECGMKGLCGSSDNRDILSLIDKGNKNAKLALNVFCNKIASYIGSYYVELGGLDAIIFTGGIGENSPETREYVCDRLKAIGVKLDKGHNFMRTNDDVLLTDRDSKVKVYRIRTNEELMIALDVERLVL